MPDCEEILLCTIVLFEHVFVVLGASAVLLWQLGRPPMPYLDIVAAACEVTHKPIVVYNVSGEYAMVKNAAANGLGDEARLVRENLLSMRRAGADLIITYHGREAIAQGWL